jgi:hypothetical protein
MGFRKLALFSSVGFWLLLASCWFLTWLTLRPKMEATCSSETSADLQHTARRYILEDAILPIIFILESVA